MPHDQSATTTTTTTFHEYTGAVNHFPLARANRFEEQKKVADFMCKIKINRNENIKKHMVQEHQENMNLMFYDFNGTANGSSNNKVIPKSQGGDRIPSRSGTFKSRQRTRMGNNNNNEDMMMRLMSSNNVMRQKDMHS